MKSNSTSGPKSAVIHIWITRQKFGLQKLGVAAVYLLQVTFLKFGTKFMKNRVPSKAFEIAALL